MKYKKKHFYIENVSTERIAKKYGTPSYVYSHNKIKGNINNFKKNRSIKIKKYRCICLLKKN